MQLPIHASHLYVRLAILSSHVSKKIVNKTEPQKTGRPISSPEIARLFCVCRLLNHRKCCRTLGSRYCQITTPRPGYIATTSMRLKTQK
jgi:hypothetical protein